MRKAKEKPKPQKKPLLSYTLVAFCKVKLRNECRHERNALLKPHKLL